MHASATVWYYTFIIYAQLTQSLLSVFEEMELYTI